MSEVSDLLKRVLMLGIGAASLTREKIEALVDELVKKGELTREEGREMVEKATGRAREEGATIKEKFSETYQDALGSMGVATSEQVGELERRITVLEARVYGKAERFEESQTGFTSTTTEEEAPT